MRNVLVFTQRLFGQNYSKVLRVSIRKPTKDGYDKTQFLDSKIVTAIGGNGADGTISIAREFCVPNAGPSGGDGGNGGHIIFKACSDVTDLQGICSIVRAPEGYRGSGKGLDGASGDHYYIKVPIGTLIKCYDTKNILSDLIREDDIYIAARGGQGGKGNKFFLSQEHRSPTIAERGSEGETKKLLVEVKLLADIGLIGMPNAGKSTLLRALTRARPKVAPYAFTTLKPHIGNIEFEDKTICPISICDIPGIVEDSHKNYGLGLEFLRHIERCHILAFIVDLNNDPINQYSILLNELQSYRSMLVSLPRIIFCNKMDILGTRAEFDTFRSYLLKTNDRSRTVAISALNSLNLTKVVFEMKNLRDEVHSYLK